MRGAVLHRCHVAVLRCEKLRSRPPYGLTSLQSGNNIGRVEEEITKKVRQEPARTNLLKPGLLIAVALATAGCSTLFVEDTGMTSSPGAGPTAATQAASAPPEPASRPAAQPPSMLAPGAGPAAAAPGSGADGTGTSPAAAADNVVALAPSAAAQTAESANAFPSAPDGTQPAAPQADLWDRIRAGFRLPRFDSPLIAAYARRFAADPDYLMRIGERARLYLYHIVEEVEKRNMPLEIALLPAIESAYHPHAHSRARAMGLWQFIAPTARIYGIKVDWWYDGRRDVLASTQAALDYLQKLHDEFNGDWFLALAAYNAGEGGIQRRISENRRRGRPTRYQDLRLLRETRHYVPKLMAFVRIVSDPAAYGITLPAIPNAPYFAEVDAGSQIDLAVVSQLAGVPVPELRSINAGFNRIATPPDGPHRILVPVDSKDALVDRLSRLPDEARIRWRRHHVRRGDTLGEIAARYGVSVREVQRANGLRGTLIRAGQDLLIPISSQPFSLRTAQAAAAQLAKAQTAETPQTAENPPAPGRTKVEHRVRQGETLWGIARRYDVHVAQLEEWNSISQRDSLHVNQTLEIWTATRFD